MDITQTPSPNFNMRKHKLDMLVLHYTGMATGEEALERMCDPAAEVSAHYMVWEDGRITQLVDEDKRAWHAGVASWQGQQDLNSRSIGIEIVNGGHDFPLPDGGLPPYPRPQIHALLDLVHDILGRHDIPATRILGHSDIAPLRKQDPGEHFPWERLARAGISLWPEFDGTTKEIIGKGLERGTSGSSDDDLQSSADGVLRVLCHCFRSAMSGQNPRLECHSKLGQDICSRFHDGPIRLTSHRNTDKDLLVAGHVLRSGS